MYLYHYFEKTAGPFVSLSELPVKEAKAVLDAIRQMRPTALSASRDSSYMEMRQHCEEVLRSEFAKAGGVLQRATPHYMVVEHCPWLSTWYENCGFVKIPIVEFDLRTVSFTYGDSMPTFSPLVNDNREYRRRVYTYGQILELMEKYGLPQEWNDDGRHGPERYIEAHVWSDEPIDRYRP